MKKIFAIAFLILCCSCKKQDDVVKTHQWKYGDGFHIGDWVQFNDTKSEAGFYFSNDTIYKAKQPVALVQKTEYNVDHYVLHITSITKDEKGLYFDKGTR